MATPPEVHGEDICTNSSKLHDDIVWIRGVNYLEVFYRGLEMIGKPLFYCLKLLTAYPGNSPMEVEDIGICSTTPYWLLVPQLGQSHQIARTVPLYNTIILPCWVQL